MYRVTTLKKLLEANQEYTRSYTLQPVESTPQVALVLCMDARINPWAAFGLKNGEVHVIRNAGGRIADAIRSLVISQTMFDTKAVGIIHHTECGMLSFTDEAMRKRLREERHAVADDVAFLPFADLEESVRDDLILYRQSPLLRQDIPVRGYIFDLATGALREVEP